MERPRGLAVPWALPPLPGLKAGPFHQQKVLLGGGSAQEEGTSPTLASQHLD